MNHLSALPQILTKSLGADHHQDNLILIYLDRNDYVLFNHNEDVLMTSDEPNTGSDGVSSFKRKIVSGDDDMDVSHHKKQKTDVCDNPITYTDHIIKTMNHQPFMKNIITKLSYNAFQTKVPFSIAKPTIQQFVNKDITNSMMKRRPKSKKTTKQEKILTKQFITELK